MTRSLPHHHFSTTYKRKLQHISVNQIHNLKQNKNHKYQVPRSFTISKIDQIAFIQQILPRASASVWHDYRSFPPPIHKYTQNTSFKERNLHTHILQHIPPPKKKKSNKNSNTNYIKLNASYIQTDTHPRRKKSLAQFRYLYFIHTIPFPPPQQQNPSKPTSPLCTKVWDTA